MTVRIFIKPISLNLQLLRTVRRLVQLSSLCFNVLQANFLSIEVWNCSETTISGDVRFKTIVTYTTIHELQIFIAFV
jgi:hypothetical protein